jgi:hypothetical protein
MGPEARALGGFERVGGVGFHQFADARVEAPRYLGRLWHRR